jgi:hypothetical protein
MKKPSQISQALRRIAAKIDNSKQPSKQLVARDLKQIIAAMTKTAAMQTVIFESENPIYNMTYTFDMGIPGEAVALQAVIKKFQRDGWKVSIAPEVDPEAEVTSANEVDIEYFLKGF